jgi:RHS repeat-associated protein
MLNIFSRPRQTRGWGVAKCCLLSFLIVIAAVGLSQGQATSSSYKINAGGGALTTSGVNWEADQYFSASATGSKTNSISGTADPALYQVYRFASSKATFSYNIPVTGSGPYAVKLHFAEIYWTSSGKRVFSVDVEGGQGLLSDYDIFVRAGGAFTAVTETVSNITVTDGALTITFLSSVDNALISAIEVGPPSMVEREYNWSENRLFNGTAAGVVAESRTYTDAMGRPTQTQARALTSGQVVVSQALYDRRGAAAGQTLPAPVGTGAFGYKGAFVTRSGVEYGPAHFDDGAKVDAPDAVDNTTANTLGWYYSANNTLEPYVGQPYSRAYVNPAGGVTRAAVPGDSHRMGAGRESQGAEVPILTELNHYLSLRSHFVSGSPPNTSLRFEGTKQVSLDANGTESVVFGDGEGRPLASCLAGGSYTGIAVSADIVAPGWPGTGPAYVDIHVPNVGAGVNTSVTMSGSGTVRIHNLRAGTVGSPVAPATTSLAAGFYRIESVSGSQTVSYTLKYGDFSYRYYDDAGRLVASVAPKGVDLASTAAPAFADRYEYDAAGRLLSQTTPDAGKVEYVYSKDGSLRFSQSAQQKQEGTFSYTNYDRLGRPLQSGLYTMSTTAGVGQAFQGHKANPVLSNSVLQASVLEDKTHTGGLDLGQCSERTYTWYDTPFAGGALGARVQRFVLGAVSKTQNAASTTWYSYDEQGRVEWVVQRIVDFGTKTIDYTYDFNGNVLEVDYQRGAGDQFSHYYAYDADQRLSLVYTSRDKGVTKTQRAKYIYYAHGPLKRVELADKLQGIDYVYTVQGWLKSINHADPDKNKDPGKDGVSNGFAPDAFGLSLDYFSGDYVRNGSNITSAFAVTSGGVPQLYTGQVVAAGWHTEGTASNPGLTTQLSGFAYRYDKKYQLSEAIKVNTGSYFTGFDANLAADRVYGIAYDQNGNLTGMKRHNGAGALADDFIYSHDLNTNHNKLYNVRNIATSGTWSYEYDLDGRTTMQATNDNVNLESIKKYVTYGNNGLVTSVHADAAKTQLKVSLGYDEGGFRIRKTNHSTGLTTYYVNDPWGNPLAVYAGTVLSEVPLYGASRLGVLHATDYSASYELSDHLGSVRAVIKGAKEADGTADVDTYTDYLPFGAVWRSGGTNTYRHGYQGQFAAKDRDGGYSDWEAFELRMYEARIGRWLSPDPYGQYWSPYLAMGNDPLNQVDPDGGWGGVPCTTCNNLLSEVTVVAANGVKAGPMVARAALQTTINTFSMPGRLPSYGTFNFTSSSGLPRFPERGDNSGLGVQGKWEHFFDGDRVVNGFLVDQSGIFTGDLAPITGMPPSPGIGRGLNYLNIARQIFGRGSQIMKFQGNFVLNPGWKNWATYMSKRGWNFNEIQQTLTKGKWSPHTGNNYLNPGNSMSIVTDPKTGKSLIIDNISKEIIQLGGKGWIF